MSFWEKLWNWLNGNKTVIGLLILQVANSVPEDLLVLGFLPLKSFLEWAGGILAGAGAIHKIAKATTAPGPNH